MADNQQIQLSIVLPPSHQNQMQELLRSLYQPDSPNYHHWLQQGAFAAQFGPTADQVAAVQAWLHVNGLTHTVFSGFAIEVTATANQLSNALSVQFVRYRTPSGRQGYVAQSAPLVPLTLASGQIAAILGLNTVTAFQSQPFTAPLVRADGAGSLQADVDGLSPCAAAQSAAGSSYYTLDTLGAAYGIGSLVSDGQNGHGQSVGLYELASSSASDISTYKTCFGLSNPVSVVSVDGGGGAVGGGGTEEADVDIEQVATQSPSVSVVSYEGPNSGSGPYDTWNAIVSADSVRVVSTSWGLCEPLAVTDGYLNSFSTLFAEAAADGQTILSASGDAGSEGCYPSDQSTALEVDYPSSDPSVTAVGGTDLFGPGDEVAWIGSGGGISRYWADPTWQPIDRHWTASGNQCGIDCREVPDLSANAGVGMVVYQNGAWSVVGGTSLSSPFIAGLVADRNGGCVSSTADLAPLLYGASTQSLYGTALTDITSGNNDETGSYGGADYPATGGYDPVTGLGSPIAAGLSCPEVLAVSAGTSGSEVTVSGLGLEHATITFGSAGAQIVSATATAAIVVVPSGHGTVTVKASSALGSGNQTATFTYGPVTIPAFPTFGAYPSWLSSTGQVGNTDVAEGSDTTLFMMQSISNTYNTSGILPFGCQLATDLQHCNMTGNPNVSQSDPLDNFTGTQELQGTWDVGSGNGQDAICGKINLPINTKVDYARSSKPYSDTCAAQELGYAKDAIAAVDFVNIDPEAYGTASGYIGHNFISYNPADGSTITKAFPSGGIGSVAAGWEPGDPYTCVAKDSGATLQPLLGNSLRRGRQHADLRREQPDERRHAAVVHARFGRRARSEPDHGLGSADQPDGV